MNRALVYPILGLAMFLTEQVPAQQTDVPTSKKVVKDRAEYDTYVAALNAQDPAAKAAAMEAFVAQYPNSVVKIEALEQAMQAYQQQGNQGKVLDTATRILGLDSNSLRALAIVTFIERAGAVKPEQWAKLRADGEKGLALLPDWKKPEGVSDAEFSKLRNQMTVIFAGAAGFGALQTKDYTTARTYYLRSLQVDINNLQDVYQLGIACLEPNPIDKNGFWYIAKAYNLAQGNATGQKSIDDYGRSKYRKYHGNYDGWAKLVAAVATQSAPGPEIAAITPAPTPCDLAVQAVRENDPGGLSFSDREFILSKADCSPANKDAADKVWKSIQDLEKGGEARLQIPVKVISATTSTIEAAIAEDNQQSNKADLHVELETPVAQLPAPGTMTNITGVITRYTADPFLFTMERGELPAPAKPQPKRPPARKTGATKKK
ncbi:MAG TPA: hypothetical protein VKL40_05880 [Candidatus Angelobacter sp.]|nr:hypothetical protein [Candidatus Angelobacter sp.]